MATVEIPLTAYTAYESHGQHNATSTLTDTPSGDFRLSGSGTYSGGPDNIGMSAVPNGLDPPGYGLSAIGELDFTGVPDGAFVSAIRMWIDGLADANISVDTSGPSGSDAHARYEYQFFVSVNASVDDALFTPTFSYDSGDQVIEDDDSGAGARHAEVIYSLAYTTPATLSTVTFSPAKTVAEVSALYGFFIAIFYANVGGTGSGVSSSASITADTDTYMYPTVQVDYTVAAGTVTGVTPSKGSVFGEQSVTITGTGFNDATGVVTFGGTALENVAIVNDTTITGTTPMHTSGLVDVVVEGVGTGTGLYTFVIPTLKLPPMPYLSPLGQPK